MAVDPNIPITTTITVHGPSMPVPPPVVTPAAPPLPVPPIPPPTPPPGGAVTRSGGTPGSGGGTTGSGGTGTGSGTGGVAPADVPAPQPDQPGTHVFWERMWKLTLTTGGEVQGAKPMPGEEGGTGDPRAGGGTRATAPVPPDTPGSPDFSITNVKPEPAGAVDGRTMDLSDYHLVFEVEQSAYSTPWHMTVRVYNLEQDVMQFITKEYTQVKLDAGYKHGPNGTIFNGIVSYFERGRESNTETVLIIHAQENDLAWNETGMNNTMPAGSTSTDVVKACVAEMGKNGKIELGAMSELSTGKSPRARTLYGQSRDILRDVTQSEDATAHIADGKLNVLKLGDVLLPGQQVVLNSTTGMIGIPYQTLDGAINVRSLLNPQLMPARLVKVNEKDIRQIAVKNAGLTKAEMGSVGYFNEHNQIAADGQYKIYSLRHTGDNRGNDWYTDIVTDKVLPTQMAPSVG